MGAEEFEALVQQLTGALTEDQRAQLPGLRRGAELGLRARLRRDAAAACEELLDQATAVLVSGWLQAAMPERFTAGDFAVSRDARASERRALAMLAPWLAEPFAFWRV